VSPDELPDSVKSGLARRDSCLSGRSNVPILLQPSPGRGRSRFPRGIGLYPHPSPASGSFAASATLHRRRRRAKPLDAIEDRCEQLARYDEALRDHHKAIEIAPDRPALWHDRAWLHYAVGRFSEALADATEALRPEPEDVAAYRVRGHPRAGLGDVDEGLVDLAQAIRRDSFNIQAYLNRGMLYGQAGRWEDVIADSTRAIQLAPDDSQGLQRPSSGPAAHRAIRAGDPRPCPPRRAGTEEQHGRRLLDDRSLQ
jgi:tetratricopeptide (TPR) repeat protein